MLFTRKGDNQENPCSAFANLNQRKRPLMDLTNLSTKNNEGIKRRRREKSEEGAMLGLINAAVGDLLRLDFYNLALPERLERQIFQPWEDTFKNKTFNDDEQDLYSPRLVKGQGCEKHGVCPICFYQEGVMRWFNMKFSAYWYHLNYVHGISSISKRPHPPPSKTRLSPRDPLKSAVETFSALLPLVEALCAKCGRWVSVVGPKRSVVKVPQIYWWKHAQECYR